MVGVAGVHRQAMLPGTSFEITDVGVDAATPVITAALFSGPRATRLPAVKHKAHRVSTKLSCRASCLRPRPSPASSWFVLFGLLSRAASRAVAAVGRLLRRTPCWCGAAGPLLVSGITPPLP